jgi:hypothetical protein
MAQTKKPARKKSTVSRTPSKGVKTLMPKISSAKPSPKILMPKKSGAAPSQKVLKANKSGVTVVLPNGSTVGLKDLGKVKPTPKPTPKVTPKKTPKMTPQDAAMQKILKDRYGW